MRSSRSGPFVDDETFRKAVEPYATMLRQLADAGYRPRQERGAFVPAADSEGMLDRAAESRYAGVWDDTPLLTAQVQVGLLMTAGEDAMLTFADIVLLDRTPIFSFVPVARAGMEYLAQAAWLAEPRIGTRERVRRSLNERIHSAWEQSRLPENLNPEPGRMDRLLSAESLEGLGRTEPKESRVPMFTPPRPSITAQVKRVYDDNRLGQVVYSYFSAISHGTHWGLASRATDVEEDDVRGLVAALSIGSDTIGMTAVALSLAHNVAWTAFYTYMGWQPDGWDEACRYARELTKHMEQLADDS